MARKLRIEYEGAMYHVINRGNYRADIFATEGAKEHQEKLARVNGGEREAQEARELIWAQTVERWLKILGRGAEHARMHMGDAAAVSRYVRELREGKRPGAARYARKISKSKV